MAIGQNRMFRIEVCLNHDPTPADRSFTARKCATSREQLFQILGTPGSTAGNNVRDAIAAVAANDYYYYAGACVLMIGCGIFHRSYDLLSMAATKILVQNQSPKYHSTRE